jgi:hypothetical protein
MTKDLSEGDLLSEEVRTKVRKAFRAGKRTIDLSGRQYNIERARGRAGKPFILVMPVNGMLPMAQIEEERFGSTKVKDDKGKPVVQPNKKKGSS